MTFRKQTPANFRQLVLRIGGMITSGIHEKESDSVTWFCYIPIWAGKFEVSI